MVQLFEIENLNQDDDQECKILRSSPAQYYSIIKSAGAKRECPNDDNININVTYIGQLIMNFNYSWRVNEGGSGLNEGGDQRGFGGNDEDRGAQNQAGRGTTVSLTPIYKDGLASDVLNLSLCEKVGEVDLTRCSSWNDLFNAVHEIYKTEEYVDDEDIQVEVITAANCWGSRHIVVFNTNEGIVIEPTLVWGIARRVIDLVRVKPSMSNYTIASCSSSSSSGANPQL